MKLMEHNSCHEHTNIWCLEYHVCFVCFMFVGCAFMEEKECGCFVPFNLDHKCMSLFMLVFVFHENSW